jgi:hypothetical protein
MVRAASLVAPQFENTFGPALDGVLLNAKMAYI